MQTDMPASEIHCPYFDAEYFDIIKSDSQVAREIDTIVLFRTLIDNLKNHSCYNPDDEAFLTVLAYLESEHDRLSHKYGLVCKGYFQNHDYEKYKYSRDHEFANRDEHYYERYHMYDTRKK